MIRLNGIIDEIKSLRKETNHRSALQIVRLLEGNRKLFSDKLDATDLDFMIRNFNDLADTAPKDYNTEGFKRQFDTSFESLLFHLNKIV